ncbi:transporter [Flavobacteriaceae bacterium]|nr:transporter [Flavobacteriaceae bacterium]
MFNRLLITCLLLLSSLGHAQYTEVINSNRPGFNDSPYAVGTDVYQFELSSTGAYREELYTFNNAFSWGNSLDFHMGLLSQKLELHLQIDDTQTWLYESSIFGNNLETGNLASLYAGFKFLLFQVPLKDPDLEIRSWKKKTSFDRRRLIPSIGLELGWSTPIYHKDPKDYIGTTFEYEEIHLKAQSSPVVKVMTQNNLSDRWTLLMNLAYENHKLGAISLGSYYVISDKWATFVDYKGQFDADENLQLWQGGFAHLINQNTQLNIGFGSNFNWSNEAFYANIGLSWRVDKHQDPYRKKKEVNREETKEASSFFSKQPSSFQEKKKAKRRKNKALIRN